jgi:uncharacterized cupin superfamily protein
MVPEASLEQTEHGLVPAGDGWFVLNARDARWFDRGPRGAVTRFEAEPGFAQLSLRLYVLAPGHPMSMYHWEADQEDFLVVAGEALLVVEGQERPLRQWDLVHCPARTRHTIVGAGDGACVVLAAGSRTATGDDSLGYPVDEAAARHGAAAERETASPEEAYARFPDPAPTRYRPGWLPGA